MTSTATRCAAQVTDPNATWDAIEIGQDTMPCPRDAAPDSEHCRRCVQPLDA